MNMVPLSIIVPSYNEESMISDCLASAAFADEIMVVDSFSTDRTLEIARRHTPRLLQHEFWSHGAQINWALPQAKHDWVLAVDADERVTPELAAEIEVLLRAPAYDGYYIGRRNFFLGKEIRHGLWAGDRVLRLFRRDKGRYQEKHVHSRVELSGQPGQCCHRLLHYSYRSLDDYTRKIHRFSRGGALEAFQRGVPSGPARIVAHALARLLKSYFLKRGFLDGTEGLIIALMEGDHAFLKHAKLWEMHRAQALRSVPESEPGAAPLSGE